MIAIPLEIAIPLMLAIPREVTPPPHPYAPLRPGKLRRSPAAAVHRAYIRAVAVPILRESCERRVDGL